MQTDHANLAELMRAANEPAAMACAAVARAKRLDPENSNLLSLGISARALRNGFLYCALGYGLIAALLLAADALGLLSL